MQDREAQINVQQYHDLYTFVSVLPLNYIVGNRVITVSIIFFVACSVRLTPLLGLDDILLLEVRSNGYLRETTLFAIIILFSCIAIGKIWPRTVSV